MFLTKEYAHFSYFHGFSTIYVIFIWFNYFKVFSTIFIYFKYFQLFSLISNALSVTFICIWGMSQDFCHFNYFQLFSTIFNYFQLFSHHFQFLQVFHLFSNISLIPDAFSVTFISIWGRSQDFCNFQLFSTIFNYFQLFSAILLSFCISQVLQPLLRKRCGGYAF